MKKILTYCLLSFSIFSNAQDFTWVRGSSTSGALGNYGTMGTANATNDPGGRHGCAKWTDASGNLWLFGGEGYSNSSTLCWMNDLWKYDISTNQWTWIRGSSGPNSFGSYGTIGVASSTNEPGAREFAACWSDGSGNLWMFGGDGFGAVSSQTTALRLGDLWKYNIASNQWTWMHGFNTFNQNGVYGTLNTASATNEPGGRLGAGCWTDGSGNLWMFGGRGYAATGGQGYLSDLWKYNPGINQWTWVGGPNTTAQFGNYGTLGTAASTNKPGGRYFPACWSDVTKNVLYMLGGEGFATNSVGYMSDLWQYDLVSNNWTWMDGSSGINAIGVYGTQGTPAAGNTPGARFTAASWMDSGGNLWLFGGYGVGTTTTTSAKQLNDMFKYNFATSQWTWIKGSNLTGQNGTYGTQGISASTNMPGAREYNNWWKDQNSNKFWLFGGEGYDISNTSPNHMNDLWVYSYPCSPDSIIVSPNKVLCSGASLTFTAVNGGTSTIWYPTASSTASIASGSTLAISSLTAATTQSVYSYFAEANNCTVAPRASISITVNPLPTLTVSTSSASICSGKGATLVATGADTYSWSGTSSGNGSVHIIPSLTATTTFSVDGTNLNGCRDTALIIVHVNPLPTLTIAASQKTICIHHSATFTVSGASSYTWDATNMSHTITVTPTVTTVYTVTGIDANGCVNTATISEKVDMCTGMVNNQMSSLYLNVFPNPAKGSFSIKTDAAFTEANFVIVNSLGQKVFEQKVYSAETLVKSELAAGIYYYELSTEGNKSAKGKLIIE